MAPGIALPFGAIRPGDFTICQLLCELPVEKAKSLTVEPQGFADGARLKMSVPLKAEQVRFQEFFEQQGPQQVFRQVLPPRVPEPGRCFTNGATSKAG
jgi:hypothetical protein